MAHGRLSDLERTAGNNLHIPYDIMRAVRCEERGLAVVTWNILEAHTTNLPWVQKTEKGS